MDIFFKCVIEFVMNNHVVISKKIFVSANNNSL